MSAPMDLVRSLLDEEVNVKLRGNRELRGTLFAYDEHCNLVLGKTQETVYSLQPNAQITASTNDSDMLFVRGDQVIYIRQPSATS